MWIGRENVSSLLIMDQPSCTFISWYVVMCMHIMFNVDPMILTFDVYAFIWEHYDQHMFEWRNWCHYICDMGWWTWDSSLLLNILLFLGQGHFVNCGVLSQLIISKPPLHSSLYFQPNKPQWNLRNSNDFNGKICTGHINMGVPLTPPKSNKHITINWEPCVRLAWFNRFTLVK